MNHVFVSLKRHRVNNIHKLFSDKKLFDDIAFNPSNYVDYHFDHNLDDGCWFKITDFTAKRYCPDYLKGNFESKSIENNRENFEKINCLISHQNGDFYYQKVRNSSFIKRKYLTVGDKAKLVENQETLIVKEIPDAIYYKDENILIFKDLTTVNLIFSGMDELYKEATNQEVDSFLGMSFIKQDTFSTAKVSKLNRKRITSTLNKINSMTTTQLQNHIDYIKKYCSADLVFDTTDNTFVIEDDTQLRNLLYGMSERFYETEISGIKRLANSTIDL